ncbi:MAG: DNA-processing protein DprA, partial [Pseudomonadota bacterium]
MNSNELVSIIRLIRSENVGLRTFWNLISIYKTATNALSHIVDLSLRGGRDKPIFVYSKAKAEDEIAACDREGVKILSFLDKDYSNLLKTIDDYPPILFCKGNTELLNLSSVAVVGSRNASVNGLRFAHKIAKNLSEKQQVVVSGFARGIDSAAHQASSDFATVAVLAGGVDHIYPPENAELYNIIAERGLIIAELPLGAIPKPQNFPQRNRIISGISNAVVVVEAGLKSGSMITAKFALQHNRDLFAVPGFPMDPRYQGNNYLLKQGAYLLENVDDIIEVISSSKIKYTSLSEIIVKFSSALEQVFGEKELTRARLEIINLCGASPCS